MTDHDYILTVLDVFARADVHGDLLWRTDSQYAPITFFAMCNDVFSWATADWEQITKENLPVLLKAYEDCNEAGWPSYVAELFACRIRGLRPAIFAGPKHKPDPKFTKMQELFNACGPLPPPS